MFFYSIDDSKYISELKKALIETGLKEEEKKIKKYIIKDMNRTTDLYNYGYVFSNSRIEKSRENICKIDGNLKNKTFYLTLKNSNAKIESVLDNNIEKKKKNKIKTKKKKIKRK